VPVGIVEPQRDGVASLLPASKWLVMNPAAQCSGAHMQELAF